jgi:hypothetical protein
MIHSWGSASSAEPYYPDAQSGDISGTLFLGSDRPAGANVVLENMQGIGGARVKSDKDGCFRFPNISPGTYRVRVADRSDFPANGQVITMERDSITGLELRGIEEEILPKAETQATAEKEISPPWYKRRGTLVLGLLLLLGAGSCVWRSVRSTAPQVASSNGSSGWQSASGKLVSGNSQNSVAKEGKVGTEGGWSSLTASGRTPKNSPAHLPKNTTDAGGQLDRAESLPEDFTLTASSPIAGKTSPDDSSDKGKLSDSHSRPEPAERNPPPTARSDDAVPSDAEPMPANEDGDEPKAGESKLAKSSRAPLGKKRPATLSASGLSGDDSKAESALSNGLEVSPEAKAAATAANGTKSAAKSVRMKSPAGGVNAAPSPDTQADADAGTSDSSASADGRSPADQLTSPLGRKTKEHAGVVPASIASTAPSESVLPSTATEFESPPPVIESAPDKSLPKTAAPKKSSAGPPPTQPSTEDESLPEKLDNAAPSPVAAVPSKKAAKSPAAAEKKIASAAAPATDSPATSAESNEDAPSTAQAPATTDEKRSLSTPKKPAKKLSSSALAPMADESQPSEPSADFPVSRAAPPILRPVINDGSLVQLGEIHASAWKPRLVRDTILPTRPVTAAEEEAVENMRKKLLQEQSALMPATFKQPQATSGFALEIPASAVDAKNPPQWRDAAGLPPVGATVQGNRAELAWSAARPMRNSDLVLAYPDGREIAHVRFDETGTPALKAAPGTRAWYWAGIESSPVDKTAASSHQSESSFDWRLSSGASVPASWLQNDRWLAGQGRRIDIPLSDPEARRGNYGLALVDPSTGWAIECNVVVQ